MRHLVLNEYSATLLKMLNWPQELLLIFGTQNEASICLKTMFPNPPMVEAEKIKIRVQVMPFAEIDWNFQSSLDGFERFQARPLEYFISFSPLKSPKRAGVRFDA